MSATLNSQTMRLVFVCENLPYPGLLVGLLDQVSSDLCVAIILGRDPFQSSVEAPGVHQLHTGRRAGQL